MHCTRFALIVRRPWLSLPLKVFVFYQQTHQVLFGHGRCGHTALDRSSIVILDIPPYDRPPRNEQVWAGRRAKHHVDSHDRGASGLQWPRAFLSEHTHVGIVDDLKYLRRRPAAPCRHADVNAVGTALRIMGKCNKSMR